MMKGSGMTEKITIEVDTRDVLVREIQKLQGVLTKRNKAIEKLEERIAAGEGSEYAKRQYELGYKRGWIDSSSEMQEYTRKAAEKLSETSKAAFNNYLKGDALLVGGVRTGGDW